MLSETLICKQLSGAVVDGPHFGEAFNLALRRRLQCLTVADTEELCDRGSSLFSARSNVAFDNGYNCTSQLFRWDETDIAKFCIREVFPVSNWEFSLIRHANETVFFYDVSAIL